MNITLKQLQAFTTIAKEASFTKAAERLHVTQSTLSASIKLLEAETGCRLVERTTREVKMTEQGLKFLPVADRLLRELFEALNEIQEQVQLQKGFVVVAAAAAASFINYVLSPAVVTMAAIRPGIKVRLCDETTQGACKRVLSGEADFAVTTMFCKVDGLDASLVLTDTYGAVFSPDHALNSSTGAVKWGQLHEHTW